MFGCGKKLKVILYDEDEMKSYSGYISGLEMEESREIDATTLDCCHMRTIRLPITHASLSMVVDMPYQIIELDPTTMKRIAKYNLEQENKKLLKEIEEHKEKLEGLKKQYEVKKQRLKTISDIGSDIWENGAEYEKEYDEYD